MVYRCVHCGFKIADTYKQEKALVYMGVTICDNCKEVLKTREDFIKTDR
jgi:predicted RNA-binding Zn-ribbon protein involved in translation (DUF1610 family)